MLRPPLPARRPPLAAGALSALGLIAAETALLFPLGEVADPTAPRRGLPPRRADRGDRLGRRARARHRASRARSRSTSSTSSRPAASRSTRAQNWVALAVFLVAAVIAASVAEAARARAAEAEQRGREADLAAELARVLLGAPDLPDALAAGGAADRRRRSASARAGSCSARWRTTNGPPRSRCCARRSGSARCSSRPARAPRAHRTAARARGAARRGAGARAARRRGRRDQALRRCDEIKTARPARRLARPALAADGDHRGGRGARLAVARRTPSATSWPRRSTSEARACRGSSTSCSTSRGCRPARPSRAATGARSRRSCARRSTTRASAADRVELAVDRELPLIRADAAQLERAFANLLENAARHGAGEPVSVARARSAAGACSCGSSTAGPASRRAERERIFEPFYRAGDGAAARGSGSRSSRASSRPTAAGCGPSRCPARARASSSSSRSPPSAVPA